ncbi:CHASE2 domain-containing protein [Oleispirillum naphthae]|uniref:CHASE2 domain-containing protein n=1 Tax=Oleispirillum naphthae TaxID=2838853 RepID=UPI0030825038
MPVSAALLLAVLNPMGLRQATDAESRTLYARLAAPFYSAAGQAEIAVVLIDDETLSAMGESFPPSFGMYGALVETVEMAGGRGVFFDLAFLDKRGAPGSLEAFADTLSLLPVVLGAPKTALDASQCGRPGLTNLAPLAARAAEEAHVNIAQDSSQVFLRSTDPCRPGGRPAAAAALYRIWCAGRSDCSVPDDAAPMAVRWGEAFPAGYAAAHPGLHGLDAVCPSAAHRLLRSARILLGELGYGLGGEQSLRLPPLCSYHPVLKAEWLLAPDGTHADARAVMDLLRERMVLIGGSLSGEQDIAHSPVFGDVPGVYVHAMALDNLMTLGSRYYRPWPGLWGGLGWNDLIEVLLLALFGWCGNWLRHRYRRGRQEENAWRNVRAAALVAGLLLLAGLVVGLGTVLACVEVLRFEPINWVGLFLACWVIAYPMVVELLERAAACPRGGWRRNGRAA